MQNNKDCESCWAKKYCSDELQYYFKCMKNMNFTEDDILSSINFGKKKKDSNYLKSFDEFCYLKHCNYNKVTWTNGRTATIETVLDLMVLEEFIN